MLPPDPERHAFFTYGIFKPGQLGYLRIKAQVADTELGTVSGQLFERNGAALLDIEGTSEVGGYVLLLEEPEDTYCDIGEVEPEAQYGWEEVEIELQDEHQGEVIEANVLVSDTPPTPRERQLHTRHPEFGCQWWDGSVDPLFNHALSRIRDVLDETPEDLEGDEPETLTEWEAKRLFDLQMAYQLLWTAIERYLLLRYAEEGTVDARDRNAMAGEAVFEEAVDEHVNLDIDKILNLRFPGNDLVELDGSDPEAVLDFYWQLRNNVTHRGKGVRMEYDLLRTSLEELLAIFLEVRDAAFESAEELPES